MQHLHGVTTTQHLLAAGIPRAHLLDGAGHYERLGHGAYALPGARRDFLFDVALAIIIAGDDAAATGETSLFLLGVLERQPALVDLAVPEGKGSRKRRGFRVRRSSHLRDEDVRIVQGIPVLWTPFALGDFARYASDRAVAHAVSRAVAQRITTLEEIQRVTDRRGRFPGSGRLRRILRAMAGETSHSRKEATIRRELRAIGLVAHHEPFDVKDAGGRTIGQADIAFIAERLDVEIDGPHHLLPEVQAQDRIRDRRMKEHGWDVIRFLWYEVDDDPAGVARAIKRHLKRRRAQVA